MNATITERLRTAANLHDAAGLSGETGADMCRAAADEIDRLTARVAELEAALRSVRDATTRDPAASVYDILAGCNAANKTAREALGEGEWGVMADIKPLVINRFHPDCAPKGAPVLVAGGIAMKKTGGKWYSGMTDDPFTRELNWSSAWWAPIPQQNDVD